MRRLFTGWAARKNEASRLSAAWEEKLNRVRQTKTRTLSIGRVFTFGFTLGRM